jgi:hypothetical protein
MTEKESLLVSKYADKILELIEDVQADKLTQSDIQGGAMAIILSILQEVRR